MVEPGISVVRFRHTVAPLAGIMVLAATVSASAHEWYSDQFSPTPSPLGKPRSCCSDDCIPVAARFNFDTGEVEVLINDRWWPAQDPRWFIGDLPDGSWLGCAMAHDRQPRCVWGGTGS